MSDRDFSRDTRREVVPQEPPISTDLHNGTATAFDEWRKLRAEKASSQNTGEAAAEISRMLEDGHITVGGENDELQPLINATRRVLLDRSVDTPVLANGLENAVASAQGQKGNLSILEIDYNDATDDVTLGVSRRGVVVPGQTFKFTLDG
jgi:hypothetical protein